VDWLMSKRQNLGGSVSRQDYIPTRGDFDDQERTTYSEALTYEYLIWDGLVAGARVHSRQALYKDPERADVSFTDYSLFARYGEKEGAQVRLSPASTLDVSLGYSSAYTFSSRRANEGDVPQTLIGSAVLRTQLTKQWSHQLSASRSVREGFLTSAEIQDRYRYLLQWDGEVANAQAYIQSSDVEVNATDLPDYDSWTSGASLGYPLTDVITLKMNTAYSVRDNSRIDTDEALDPELTGKYATWISQIGTGLQLTKKITFNTYYQHVWREGDSDELDYERDVFAANFMFKHEF